jgi:hypothetical protein
MVTVPLELNTNVSCQADNFFSQFNIVLFVYPNVRTVAFNPMPSILALREMNRDQSETNAVAFPLSRNFARIQKAVKRVRDHGNLPLLCTSEQISPLKM